MEQLMQNWIKKELKLSEIESVNLNLRKANFVILPFFKKTKKFMNLANGDNGTDVDP